MPLSVGERDPPVQCTGNPDTVSYPKNNFLSSQNSYKGLSSSKSSRAEFLFFDAIKIAELGWGKYFDK